MGRIIDRQIPRVREVGTPQGLSRESGVSRSAIYDAMKGVETVRPNTYARLEAALHLPADTLKTAGKHDLQGLVELGVQPDLIEWVRRETENRGHHATHTRRAL